MIITKTPLRIGLVGGGTDIPAYAKMYGGSVVNVTINRHIFIAVNQKFDRMVRVSYSKTENVKRWNQVEHDLVRASLKYADIESNIEIVSMADIPGQGSGLGSSSSFTVGLLLALRQHKVMHGMIDDFDHMNAMKLAEAACTVEIAMCQKPIGKQDQYAAAIGGLNYMQFDASEVRVTPIALTAGQQNYLERHLLLFYTGRAPSSSDMLEEQARAIQKSGTPLEAMHQLKGMADDLATRLMEGHMPSFGEYLHKSWMLKRQASPFITNSTLDTYYNIARENGAIGGKICGAGGGGFMLIFAPPEVHANIRINLPLPVLPISFDMQGARVVYMDGLND